MDQSTEGSSGPKDQVSIAPGPSYHVTIPVFFFVDDDEN